MTVISSTTAGVYQSLNSDWRVPFEKRQPTPEQQASIEAHDAELAEIYKRAAELERQQLTTDAAPHENHIMSAPNVATLSREQTAKTIEFVTHLIQSGEAEQTTLQTGNGDKVTSSFRQYLYWLQQHARELEEEAPSSLGQY